MGKETPLPFDREAKKLLEAGGYSIYIFTGKSIQDFIDEGLKVQVPDWLRTRQRRGFLDLCSQASEVAIQQKKFYLTPPQTVEKFDAELAFYLWDQFYPHLRVTRGTARDYVELATVAKPGLYGEYYAGTSDVVEGFRIGIGNYGEDVGVQIRRSLQTRRSYREAHLIFPRENPTPLSSHRPPWVFPTGFRNIDLQMLLYG